MMTCTEIESDTKLAEPPGHPCSVVFFFPLFFYVPSPPSLPFSPSPSPLTVVIIMGVRWSLAFNLCFLVTNIKCQFIYLWAFWYPLMRFLLKCLAWFLDWLFFLFFCWSYFLFCMGVLCQVYVLLQIFQCVACLFTVFVQSSDNFFDNF